MGMRRRPAGTGRNSFAGYGRRTRRRSGLLDSRLFWRAGVEGSRGGGAEDAAEFGAFGVAWGGAGGGVAESVAHGGEFADGLVEFGGFGAEGVAADAEPAAGCEHESDFVE